MKQWKIYKNIILIICKYNKIKELFNFIINVYNTVYGLIKYFIYYLIDILQNSVIIYIMKKRNQILYNSFYFS